MKTYGGVDVYTHVFLISALVGGERSASRPCRFTPGERAPITHWIRDWVGLRADMEKRKLFPPPELELLLFGRPVRSQSLLPSYRRTVALNCIVI
jgi:hypothetical protein